MPRQFIFSIFANFIEFPKYAQIVEKPGGINTGGWLLTDEI
jgi:hypothetical protein